METEAKSGTSINTPRPSNQDSTTDHGISPVLEEQTNSKFGAQTQDGGNYSAMKEDSSPTCGIIEFLMYLEERILKLNQ